MPRLQPLTVTDDERAKLDGWVRRPKTAQRLALRSRIVLAAAAGQSNTAIANDLRVTLPTVGKWRQRFLDKRLDGLTDDPRPGPPRTITDAHVEDVINLLKDGQLRLGMERAGGFVQVTVNGQVAGRVPVGKTVPEYTTLQLGLANTSTRGSPRLTQVFALPR
ncbi:MAG: helix-turn-helix domain-containing protein [Gemmataceae bacterium]